MNYGNLTIEITVDDPKAYTRPWSVTVNQQIMLDTELIEFICHGEREIDGAFPLMPGRSDACVAPTRTHARTKRRGGRTHRPYSEPEPD